jgi:predicted nucleic-acid-binding protein
MTSVDTNIVIRLLIDDDPEQVAAVRSLVAAGPIWIASTVLLETAWVLHSFYGMEQNVIREALAKLPATTNVHIENEASFMYSLKLMADGVDIADAMHLAGTPPGASFASFDRDFVRCATRAGVPHVFDLSRR